MNTLGSKEWRYTKPDAQGFDEIRFVTVPRYKESGLSGDEWRISVTMQFWRKGKLVHEEGGWHNTEVAMGFAYATYAKACDDGHALYCGEDDICDQEGCAEKATVKYYLKAKYDKHSGHKTEVDKPTYRLFCNKHKQRGDCGLEDTDDNYTQESL